MGIAAKHKRVDETARIMWALFLALWFAGAFASIVLSPGCTPAQRQAAKQTIENYFSSVGECVKAQESGILATVATELLNSANTSINGGNGFTSDQWKNNVLNLAVTYGAPIVKCAVSQLYAEFKNPSASDMGLKASTRRITSKQADYLNAAYNILN